MQLALWQREAWSVVGLPVLSILGTRQMPGAFIQIQQAGGVSAI